MSLAQFFGLLSVVIAAYAFIHKNDQKLKLWLIVLFICQTVHFYLMGSFNGAAANAVNLIRTIASLKQNTRHLGFVFITINIVWGTWLLTSPIGVMPILGATIGTYALFYLQGVKMRVAIIIGASCWLTNNLYIGSIGGTMLELMIITINMHTIIKIKHDAATRPQNISR